MHISQRGNSRKRSHPAPTYSSDELVEWVLNHPDFTMLYCNWVESGYNKYLIPSVDRKDSTKGYSFENIQLVTWRTNLINHTKGAKRGVKNSLPLVPVIQMDEEGNDLREFISLNSAARAVGSSPSNIQCCCNGVRPRAKGYKWKYKNENND